MGYFGASVGEPISEKATVAEAAAAPAPTEVQKQGFFAVQVGPKACSAAGTLPAGNKPSSPRCPLCQEQLEQAEGLYQCAGRCKRRWWMDGLGKLVDAAALPYGICNCCQSPQALAPIGVGAICPRSGCEYLLLAQGPVAKTIAAPHGLCLCCIPAQPLVAQGEWLLCGAKPQQRYQWLAGDLQWLGLATAHSSGMSETLAAIDMALAQNSAHLTLHGLFDLAQLDA
jgi:hypothetical protein